MVKLSSLSLCNSIVSAATHLSGSRSSWYYLTTIPYKGFGSGRFALIMFLCLKFVKCYSFK